MKGKLCNFFVMLAGFGAASCPLAASALGVNICAFAAHSSRGYRLNARTERNNSMKPTWIAVLLALVAVTLVWGQAQNNQSVEAEIIALEKRGFEAWKNKDKKFFQDTMLEESLALYSAGVANKEQWAQLIVDPNCTVKTYDLDNIKVTMMNKDTALLTYRYTHDTVCKGKQEPSPVWASTLFVKRGKKWLQIFHQETNAEQAK
jgi:hypothetical protein